MPPYTDTSPAPDQLAALSDRYARPSLPVTVMLAVPSVETLPTVTLPYRDMISTYAPSPSEPPKPVLLPPLLSLPKPETVTSPSRVMWVLPCTTSEAGALIKPVTLRPPLATTLWP